MQTKWIDKTFAYDGSQLKSLYAYLHHEVAGDSIIAWRGPCKIPSQNIIDGEDLLQNAQICGDDMLHFVVEVFQKDLFSAVCMQRLIAAMARDILLHHTGMGAFDLRRDGDDLYQGSKKLSISIASVTPISAMIHFAVNVDNAGTPVETCSLNDLKMEPKAFAEALMTAVHREYVSVQFATVKVRPLL